MIKSFFREIGILILVNGLVFLIYSTAFGDAFHASVPGEQAFRDRNATIMASFLFFYPTLAYSTLIVYFIRALIVKFKDPFINTILFAVNVIAIGFPILAFNYQPGLNLVIGANTPLYDPLILPLNITRYSVAPLLIMLFYSAHHIPLAFEYEIPEEEDEENKVSPDDIDYSKATNHEIDMEEEEDEEIEVEIDTEIKTLKEL